MRRQAEIGLLVALCFFLPLYEAPKTIAWAAYALVWLVNRIVDRDFGGRWDGWDSLIAAWLGSGVLVALVAGWHGYEWRGALDLVRYGSVLWLLKRSRFTVREQQWLLGALVASTLVGLAMGYAALWRGTEPTLQLNSVGHVNHTGIYLAIMLGVSVAWLFTGRWPVLAGVVALAVLVSLFITASRGALGAALIAVAVLSLAWWRRARWPAVCAALLLTATVVIGVFGHAGVFEKNRGQIEAGDLLNYRDHVWRIAVSGWEAHPWFGVGVDNFKVLTRAEQEPYRSLFPHAHSLYLNTLAERGIVGTLPVAALLIAWLVALVRWRPAAEDAEIEWLLWGAAATAWIVTCVAGTVNTTLHHEHGLLVALLLGLWLAQRRSTL